MKKEKWLLQEIEAWKSQALIDGDVATALAQRYALEKSPHFLTLMFSIVGSLLIGTGVILILARNWYFLPFFIRVALAFLPLALSQCAAVYVVRHRIDSPAWREGAAILVTCCVFAAVALVGQTFHLANDYAAYILACGLLSLPMIYILDAAAPLLVYYWAILNWAPLALDPSLLGALQVVFLFAAGAAYVYLKK
jgi:uncharacterized membrane protein